LEQAEEYVKVLEKSTSPFSADAVFYIQEGKAALSVLSEQGKEAVVGFWSGIVFLGERCLIAQPPPQYLLDH
jgi:CRP-like cAMP-binding protein